MRERERESVRADYQFDNMQLNLTSLNKLYLSKLTFWHCDRMEPIETKGEISRLSSNRKY